MINSELKRTNFFRYTFEKFLQNDFFISSVKYLAEEIQEFWDRFEKSTPSDIDDYSAAREYIETISTSEGDLLSDQKLGELWADIQTANIKSNRIKHRSLFLIGLIVVVNVAILAGSFSLLKNYQAVLAPDITMLAAQIKTELPVAEETLLIPVEDKVVNLKEKETIITYDSVAIKVNEENMSRKESAAYNQLVIPHGKRPVPVSSDGSEIWVSVGTRVIYPTESEKDKREICADREIYVEVARNEEHSFYVHTRDMNVRMLSTKFNVTAYKSKPAHSVALTQGCTQVETTQAPKVILAPNQMFSLAEGKENILRVDVKQMISWVNDPYCFNSADLGITPKRLSTHYGISIRSDSVLSKIKCPEKVNLKDNFETVTNGLTFVAPISYAYDGQYRTYRVVKE